MPTTLDELTALTDKIRGEGKTPWCIAAESGQATGWPITDWIEDLVLRFAGPDNYDKWVKGELKFDSPEIKPAFDYFKQIAFTDGNVLGGTKAIVATNFQTGGNALFKQPPAATCSSRRPSSRPRAASRTTSWPTRQDRRGRGLPGQDRG